MKGYKIIGITEVSYVKDGRTVEGLTLHLGTEAPKTDGMAVQRVYISKKREDLYSTAQVLTIGDTVKLMYDMNDYGKLVLCSLEVV